MQSCDASKMAGLWTWGALLVLASFLCCGTAQNFYVVAPNTIRIGAEETVGIAMDGPREQDITVFLQDYPQKKKKFSEMSLKIKPGTPEIVRIQVLPGDVPDADFNDPITRNEVILTAHSGSFRKELIIPLSSKVGYFFLQTDKPIYTPKQSVNIRAIPVNERTLPSNEDFKIQVQNPQGIVVEETVFNQARAKRPFMSHVYKFSPLPMVGIWTVVAHHGYQFQHNSSITFELREYVLPTFSLDLKVPEVILPNYEKLEVSLTASYVYGKKVKGYATFKYGVKSETGKVIYFGVTPPIQLNEGKADSKISTRELKDHKSIGWFPQIEGSYLVVEATVRDEASGNKELAVDHKSRFSKSPFTISFRRSLRDFKPGLISIVEADVMYINGRPASGVTANISAVANNNIPIKIKNPQAVSDDEGKLSFQIHPEMHHNTLKITVTTVYLNLADGQAQGTFMQEKFSSRSGGYIAIAKRIGNSNIIKPNSKFSEDVHFHPAEMSIIYYVVVTRGRIVKMGKLPEGKFKVQSVEFPVDYSMVPSFRVVVFALHRNDLIADSLKVDVDDQCHPNAEVVIDPQFPQSEPGRAGNIELRGLKDTFVGLLAVDKAVYALRNKDLLTKTKMFDTMESHDMGCGPGGGKTTNAVLGNAGVVIVTNTFSPPGQKAFSACVENVRKRREIKEEYAKNFTGFANKCCKLGMSIDRLGRSCEERAEIVKNYFSNDTSEECSNAFLDCCLFNINRSRTIGPGVVSTAGGNSKNPFADVDLQHIPEEEEDFFEKGTTARKDFRETWIFQDIVIGSANKYDYRASLPHSITTWVIQAVSVSQQLGMCVSTPKEVVSFKKVFLQLNLPYSVIRNEQVEVQAVVFNYGHETLPVVVYMYGVKDICSGTRVNEKSERKKIMVDRESAVSVKFPIIPLNEGSFDLQVVALSASGSDVIIRKLNVIPEGHTVTKEIPIKLDPANTQKRRKRAIVTPFYEDSIDESKNLQLTSIKLTLPENFVPGTESCVITALGDEFGPTIETTLQNPDTLLRQAVGCGEQTMIFLAPTMYTMNYLKAKGKITPAVEAKGFGLIRDGIQRELNYRKPDGSYAAFTHRPASTWLTAFVMKVFCQASKLVHIDENVICSGINWLISNQQPDGSFIDHHPVIHRDMMGGVNGLSPMTAFVLIALQECSCDKVKDLEKARVRAVAYLENHLGNVVQPLPVAIVSYALALAGSEMKNVAYTKLVALERRNADANTLHWGTGNGAHEVEVTSYGLLAQLQFNNMVKSNSIVNWLNNRRLASGSFPSTQDTIIALQALSEYEISAKGSTINLMSNITSSNDRSFQKTMMFDEGNSLVLQQYKVDKVGGLIFINTAGHGVGQLTVKLKYNIPTPPETLCKFELTVNVSEAKEPIIDQPIVALPNKANDVFIDFEPDLIRAIGADKGVEKEEPELKVILDPRSRKPPVLPEEPLVDLIQPEREIDNPPQPRNRDPRQRRLKLDDVARVKREDKPQNSILTLKVQICTRYLGNTDRDMTLVEAGVFSGFQAVREDLEKLVKSDIDMVQKYEITSNGVVFYLEKAPKGMKYCFAFRIKRDYIVGNTQSSVIKVFDYYNPDESCTLFYSPDSSSPMLRKICDNGICQCAEGGCPPTDPFRKLSELEKLDDDNAEIEIAQQEMLRSIVCEDNDYTWRGQVVGEITREAGFLNVPFEIEKVIKEGIEKGDTLVGAQRTLLARDNCLEFIPKSGSKYIVMGKDGQRYLDDKGNTWHRYLLDKTSSTFVLKGRSKIRKLFIWLQNQETESLCKL